MCDTQRERERDIVGERLYPNVSRYYFVLCCKWELADDSCDIWAINHKWTYWKTKLKHNFEFLRTVKFVFNNNNNKNKIIFTDTNYESRNNMKI